MKVEKEKEIRKFNKLLDGLPSHIIRKIRKATKRKLKKAKDML